MSSPEQPVREQWIADRRARSPYRILGLFPPAPNSKWKAGQTVPIKFALADAAGVRISDTTAAAPRR